MKTHRPHELKLSIRRNETDRARGIEFVQTYALMESTVVQFDSVTYAAFVLVDHQLVVEAKLAFWSPGQVCSHLDVPINIGAKDSSYTERKSS